MSNCSHLLFHQPCRLVWATQVGISHGRQWICNSTRVCVRVIKGSGVFVLSSGSDWIPSVTEWNALLNGSDTSGVTVACLSLIQQALHALPPHYCTRACGSPNGNTHTHAHTHSHKHGYPLHCIYEVPFFCCHILCFCFELCSHNAVLSINHKDSSVVQYMKACNFQ